MQYSMETVAEKRNLSVHLPQYYNQEDFLPFVERDIILCNHIECLKKTGMLIQQYAY